MQDAALVRRGITGYFALFHFLREHVEIGTRPRMGLREGLHLSFQLLLVLLQIEERFLHFLPVLDLAGERIANRSGQMLAQPLQPYHGASDKADSRYADNGKHDKGGKRKHVIHWRLFSFGI
jgi:hypothetical protein